MACTAILDWEMVSPGGPLMDLGWWTNWDRFSRGNGGGPPGYPNREETLRVWRSLTGIATDDLPWYEVFAVYRLALICGRVVDLHRSLGSSLDLDMIGLCVASSAALVDSDPGSSLH